MACFDKIADGSRTVLVVDDEALLRAVAADFFADSGFKVLEAACADEAMSLLEQGRVHLLFSDIQMPGSMDGAELARVACARWPQMRIILTSGSRRPSACPLPATAFFVSKPYYLPSLAKLAAAA